MLREKSKIKFDSIGVTLMSSLHAATVLVIIDIF